MAATQNPPRTLNVQKLAETRGPEIDSLHSIVSNRLSNDFSLRRSDRRRTTSHVRTRSKRRRSSSGHVDASSEGQNGEKKVCRRERRRRELKSNPELGFSVASDSSKRLRTHVWHAKRFKMVKRWGFYLPLGIQGRGRGSRALLKWLQNGTLVHDASYYFPIQLEGQEDSILSILRKVLLPVLQEPSELSSDKLYNNVLAGTHYKNAMLYHVGSSPSRLIAPITYMWRHVNGARSDNNNTTTSSQRQLWIWIHAAAFEEGLAVLKSACENQQVSCFGQEGRIAQLEITGTKASHLIQKILHPIAMSKSGTNNDSCLVPCTNALDHKHFTLDQLEKIPRGTIIPLTVQDPRQISSDSSMDFDEITIDSDSSNMLWDPCCKIDPPVAENLLCKEKNKRRLSSLFLGPANQDAPRGQQNDGSCPVILLKHASDFSISRWSIILPLNWLKPFWLFMVSNGARAIGSREKHWVSWKNNIPCFPYDFPDTKAYSNFMANEAASNDESAQLRPHAMRPHKIPMPPPWNCINGDVATSFKMFVPRSLKALKECVEKMDCNAETGSSCLVRVSIRAFREGSFEDGAVICAPNLDDLSGWNNRSRDKVEEYEEKWKLEMTQSLVESYFTQLESGEWVLPVPVQEDTIAVQSFRRPIGFLTTGFVHGCNERVAMGFCDVKILTTLRRRQYICTEIKRDEIFVLVRNMRSAAYRRAVATVVLEERKEDLEFM